LAYLPLAGFLFPRHRRIVEYWAPKRLPRIRPRQQAGVTLIEMLIAVAIISILAVPIAFSTSIVFRSARAQSEWRSAISLAEDEIALLRARAELPEPGTYGVDLELAESHPLADLAEVEILPGPAEGVREARITVRLSKEGDAVRRDVVLAVLLPAGSAGEAGQ
jgi:prepilin-type N-terminal cleavage/methylation domain-containing protein